MNYRITAPQAINATIAVPASKSISARALVINALSSQPATLHGVAVCDDTHALIQGLDANHGTIDVGAAGTAMRFLTAFHAAQPGHDVVLDGCDRMRQRPMQPLLEALRALGAHIACTANDGHAPLHIVGSQLQGGQHIALRGDVSSQFTSALMMIAPLMGGLEIELTGEIVSAPYIDMTLAMMRHWGVNGHWHGNTISVPAGTYDATDLSIEADWSAASYWMALQALLPDSHISLTGLQPDSWQGDSRMLTFMQQLGMRALWNGDGTLTLDMSRTACCCCSTFADLNGTPDLAPTLIAMLCLLGRPFRLTGLRTLHHKESDRLEVLRSELAKLGYLIQIEGQDAVTWHFQTCEQQSSPRIDSHGDHRIAMAMALAATRHPGIVITQAQAVEKSYPQFWKHLQLAGFTITQES
ncbi:MAG: 3-phosphoshikimate 1-carboxyvinyltransferase [Muribaculaceae bacterium]|nr:3-phosphoshikimate 1-carboxyvinyltransferase [Muribaculaceae bacterium]